MNSRAEFAYIHVQTYTYTYTYKYTYTRRIYVPALRIYMYKHTHTHTHTHTYTHTNTNTHTDCASSFKTNLRANFARPFRAIGAVFSTTKTNLIWILHTYAIVWWSWQCPVCMELYTEMTYGMWRAFLPPDIMESFWCSICVRNMRRTRMGTTIGCCFLGRCVCVCERERGGRVFCVSVCEMGDICMWMCVWEYAL